MESAGTRIREPVPPTGALFPERPPDEDLHFIDFARVDFELDFARIANGSGEAATTTGLDRFRERSRNLRRFPERVVSPSPEAMSRAHLLASHFLMLSASQPGTPQPSAPSLAQWRRGAFVERCLSNLDEDAENEGVELASNVRAEAERVLRALPSLPDDTDVYARDDGKVAIEVLRNPGAIFVLQCEPEGGALCIVVLDGLARTLRYDASSSQIPDCFVEQGLQEVLRHGGRS